MTLLRGVGLPGGWQGVDTNYRVVAPDSGPPPSGSYGVAGGGIDPPTSGPVNLAGASGATGYLALNAPGPWTITNAGSVVADGLQLNGTNVNVTIASGQITTPVLELYQPSTINLDSYATLNIGAVAGGGTIGLGDGATVDVKGGHYRNRADHL